MRCFHETTATFLFLVAFGVAGAAEWDDYAAAEKALVSGDCARAVTMLGNVIAIDGTESERKNTYGMHFERYVPRFLLARAHLCGGDGDLALAELQASERQGVVDRDAIAELKSQIQDLDGGASELVWRARQAFLSGDLLWAQGLVEQALVKAPEHRGGRALAAQLSGALRIDKLLVEARVLLARGDAAGARGHAREVLGLDGGNEEAKRVEASALAELDRGEEAAARIRKDVAPAGRPTSVPRPAVGSPTPSLRAGEADALLREAQAYVRIGDVQGAVAAAARAATRNVAPDKIEALIGEIAREMAKGTGGVPEEMNGGAIRRQFFRDAVRAFHSGRYDDALVRMSVAEQELEGSADFHFYRGAATLVKYLLGGARDGALLTRSQEEFARVREVAPGYAPDPEAFSPRILEVFTRLEKAPGEGGPTRLGEDEARRRGGSSP